MSPTAAPQVNQTHSVNGVTALLLLLLPCTSTLLLLHCLLLLCRLLLSCRRRTPQDLLSCRRRTPEDLLSCRRRTPDDLQSRSTLGAEELLLHAVSSSPLLGPGPRPDTATGASSRALSCRMRLPGSQRTPSIIRASCCCRITPGVEPGSSCCRVTPGLDPGSSGSSETEVGIHLVPPNSPMFPDHLFRQSCSVLTEVPGWWLECRDQSCSSRSALGPGLDSDFGASAGVSLRILSSDSDGLSSAALTPGLEWDYYDPCYVRQNNVPQRQQNRPSLHCKHYWV